MKFWRINDEKYEVDLVLELEKKAYEIKFKFDVKEKDLKWLKKFSQPYSEFETGIINRNNFLEIVK